MFIRGILSPTRCSSAAHQLLRLRQTPALEGIWYQIHDIVARRSGPALPRSWVRGAKRTSTIKAASLPQGVLPPLPKLKDAIEPEKTYPPVLQQHLNNVRKFSDCIVLTRIGDFYEMYFDQVDQYAHLVNLKKAKRATALGDVAMAGFQHTQLDRYLKMFVQDHGKQVAISEQVRLPESQQATRHGGPRFDRKVTRIITPGTLIDETFVDPLENNFLLGVNIDGAVSDVHPQSAAQDEYRRATKVGLSWIDLSSGDFYTQVSDLASLSSLVARIGPRELVLDASMEDVESKTLQNITGNGGFSMHFQRTASKTADMTGWADMLEVPLSQDEQSAFTTQEVSAGALILDYVRGKLLDTPMKLQPPVRRSDDEYMSIDKQSLRGLEIRATMRDGLLQGSLLHSIRRTVTKSGARLLTQRLVSPLLSLSVINNRLDLVQEFLCRDTLREHMVALLRNTYDTFRLLQKFSIGKGDADDMLSLAKTIAEMQQISVVLHDHVIANQDNAPHTLPHEPLEKALSEYSCFWDVLQRFNFEGPARLATAIQAAIDEEGLSRQHAIQDKQALATEEMTDEVLAADVAGDNPPQLARRASKQSSTATSTSSGDAEPDIWIMRKSASETLKRAHRDLEKLLEAKSDLTSELRTQTRFESLTLKWSAQLGHFCHVKGKDTSGAVAALPGARSLGSTKSTRTFYLSDWTHLGVRIDDAKLRIRSEENHVFNKLRGQVLENLMRLRRNAAVLDELDVACSSASLAKENDLIRPVLDDSTIHHIVGGRHPTVAPSLRSQGRHFIANDCSVGAPGQRIHLLTGPNMAGKSTYLRQNVLITILAQTGCFVPAEYARIGLVDKVFSRVGSADNLYQDQSTFMVEMLEAAEILKSATSRSFVIMDEVGRGTTPEDGVAVGYACLHHLHNVNKCRALFATHFHKLADMTQGFEGLKCFCTDVEEEGGANSWTYVRKVREGVNRNSHALKVARMAGMPEESVRIADEVLRNMGAKAVDRRIDAAMHQRAMEAAVAVAAVA